jgi:hypothetical protein
MQIIVDKINTNFSPQVSLNTCYTRAKNILKHSLYLLITYIYQHIFQANTSTRVLGAHSEFYSADPGGETSPYQRFLYDGLSEKSAKFYLTLMSNGVVVV